MSKVAIGLSGGVDSSVAAATLLAEGHEVIGLAMRLYDAPAEASRSCCSPDDLFDARHVADLLGIPFYVLNFKEVFRQAVIDPWVKGYREGLTPNPCIRCNGLVKFRALTARADALGADFLATGHFARVGEIDGQARLGRAANLSKDQSYFLYQVPQDRLSRFMLPLADLTKEQVRAEAEALGLPTAAKQESQDACFVQPHQPHEVVRRFSGVDPGEGDIVDERGEVLGRHKGFDAYTIGQRRGLGLGGGPWYVVSVGARNNRVVVRRGEVATTTSVRVGGANWHVAEAEVHGRVKLRSRGEGDWATVRPAGTGRFDLVFDAPTPTPAPGQAAVVYDAANWIVCGGTILPG
jgi:tRNA-uridine 2-sulfurtransferase